ncbi:hypothetical protein GCM10010413_46980 [Promicromonospora sukumoe]
MQLGWSDPRLEGWCLTGARLSATLGAHADAAEDLLHVVSQAPRLEHLATFQSVQIDVDAGNLTLSIEEVDMHARPLSPDGAPYVLANRASLPDHALSQALLVQDLLIQGQSILRLKG